MFQTRSLLIQLFDVDTRRDETVLQHQREVDSFLRLRHQQWPVIALVAEITGLLCAKHFTDAEFFHVAYRSRGTVRVQVVDRRVTTPCIAICMQRTAPGKATVMRHRMLRRNRRFPHRYARRAHRRVQLFDSNHTATARDDKPITVRIIVRDAFSRRIVIFGGQCAHIASNSQAISQHSSSPPPAKRCPCLPSWICSAALPIRCAEVAQARNG